MYRYIKGKLTEQGLNYSVVETGGVGYLIYTSRGSQGEAEKGGEVKFFCHLHVREELLELYGFTEKEELSIFQRLISVSGVGPRSAIGILNVAGVKDLVAAIKTGKPELLTRVSGIGKKTAERVVLELREKLEGVGSGESIAKLESDNSIEEALMSLGYNRGQAREALGRVDEKIVEFEERLKEALKIIGGKR